MRPQAVPGAAAPQSLAHPESARVEHRIEPIAAEWEGLARRLGAPPFLRPGWAAAWWHAFGAGGLEIHSVRREGRLAALLPVIRRHGALRSAMNCHTPQFGLLAEDSFAAAAVARSLFAGGPHRVSIASLDPDGDAMRVCRRAAEEAGYRVLVRPYQRSPYLQVEGAWTDYEVGLSRSLIADLHRSRRRLAACGSVEVEIADGRERLEERIGEAFAVEASGWKGERGTAIRSRPDTLRFYTGLARWAAESGVLRLFFLRLDGRPIAMFYALEEGGVCHLLKGGYDPAYRRCSPGKLLLHAVLGRAFAAGWSRVEFHGGEEPDPYKLRWTPAVTERQRFEAFSPSPGGRLAWAAVAYARPAARLLLGPRRLGRARRQADEEN